MLLLRHGSGGYTVPFGCVKSPFSTPVRKALLNWESNTAAVAAVDLLFANMYFLMAGRLCGRCGLVICWMKKGRDKKVNKNSEQLSKERDDWPAAIALFKLRVIKDASAFALSSLCLFMKIEGARGNKEIMSTSCVRATMPTHVEDSVLDHICRNASVDACDHHADLWKSLRQ